MEDDDMKIKENTKIYKALTIAQNIYSEKGQDDRLTDWEKQLKGWMEEVYLTEESKDFETIDNFGQFHYRFMYNNKEDYFQLKETIYKTKNVDLYLSTIHMLVYILLLLKASGTDAWEFQYK